MRTNFYIRASNPGRATIYCHCTLNGKTVYFSTKLSVPTDKWNASKQRADGIVAVNHRLNDIEDICLNTYNALAATTIVTPELFKHHVIRAVFSDNAASPFVIPYYEKWSTEIRPDKKPSRQCRLSCNVFKKHAKADITFPEITHQWIDNFLLSLQNEGYSLNYIGVHLKNLKAMMNAALRDGLHNNTAFREFKKMEEDADATYLTEEEIAKLESADNLTDREAKARDLFLVGYYTAMRFSDYSRLALSDIADGIIKFNTKKTGEQVLIPANPKLIAILERYGGKAPKMAEQHLNYFIKEACKSAGIDDFVTKNVTKGGKTVSLWRPKYEFVSSHTARRSGATNMYKAGIKSRYIMMITGHQSEASFRRYIRITKQENAENLADNEFFKG